MLTPAGRPVRTVLLYAALPSISDERQARFCLRFAAGRGLDVVCLAGRSPAAALAAVRGGTAEAVLAALQPSDDSLAGLVADVERLGGSVHYARAVSAVRAAHNAEETLIRTALGNGGDVELVAQLLGVPVARVRTLAGTAAEPEARVLVDLRRWGGRSPRSA